MQSDLNAAYLWAQLEQADKINDDRLATWQYYFEQFKPLADAGKIELPVIPEGCEHNAHMFYLKCTDLAERSALIKSLKAEGVSAVFHYIPLHSSPAGQMFGRFCGEDEFTTVESERLVRLPMYYGMTEVDREAVVSGVKRFYE